MYAFDALWLRPVVCVDRWLPIHGSLPLMWLSWKCYLIDVAPFHSTIKRHGHGTMLPYINHFNEYFSHYIFFGSLSRCQKFDHPLQKCAAVSSFHNVSSLPCVGNSWCSFMLKIRSLPRHLLRRTRPPQKFFSKKNFLHVPCMNSCWVSPVVLALG